MDLMDPPDSLDPLDSQCPSSHPNPLDPLDPLGHMDRLPLRLRAPPWGLGGRVRAMRGVDPLEPRGYRGLRVH